ncbi:hypothetical protein FQN57_002257 [Myotisia sp. PD_48]|nr:hypothetical protein FQN57_002257 [Myotisia sp. PD_48]
MAPGSSLASLEPHTRELVEFVSQLEEPATHKLSQEEEEILKLYDRVFEQRLEEALLKQSVENVDVHDDIDAQLVQAERELLETRATVSVQRKIIEATLMSEPTIQAIHSTPSSPLERTLLPLLNRRDVLSLVDENLAMIRSTCLERISDAEVDNIESIKQNQKLVQSLLEFTKKETSLEDGISDPALKEELVGVKTENQEKKADWERIKRIVSAGIVASGVDWAGNEELEELVLDDESMDDI